MTRCLQWNIQGLQANREKLEQSDREDTALRNTRFLVIQLRETWIYPNLEVPALKKTFSKCRQSISQTCTVQVPHDSIFPCCVVGFFEVKEDGNSVLSLDKSIATECFEVKKMISIAAIFYEIHIEQSWEACVFLNTRLGGHWSFAPWPCVWSS